MTPYEQQRRSLWDGTSRNSIRGCTAPGCTEPRLGLNAQCRQHLAWTRKYGHPEARPIKRAWLDQHRKDIEALFHANSDHAGLQQALAYLQGWMVTAAGNPGAYKGAEEVARLHRCGVSPLAVLVEVCALAAWVRREPSFMPDDKAEDYAISRAVFGLAPRPRIPSRGPNGSWPSIGRWKDSSKSHSKKPRVSALAAVGKHLRTVLSSFVANVLIHLERLEEQRQKAREAEQAGLSAPFKLPE